MALILSKELKILIRKQKYRPRWRLSQLTIEVHSEFSLFNQIQTINMFKTSFLKRRHRNVVAAWASLATDRNVAIDIIVFVVVVVDVDVVVAESIKIKLSSLIWRSFHSDFVHAHKTHGTYSLSLSFFLSFFNTIYKIYFNIHT